MHQPNKPAPPEKYNPQNKKIRAQAAHEVNELCKRAGITLYAYPGGIYVHSSKAARRLRRNPVLYGLVQGYANELAALMDDLVE